MSDIILEPKEDGTWGIREEPYATVEFVTEEDFLFAEEALAKAVPKEHLKNDLGNIVCGTCKGAFKTSFIRRRMGFCPNCGQAVKWV